MMNSETPPVVGLELKLVDDPVALVRKKPRAL